MTLITLLMSCDTDENNKRRTCDLYNADQIDAVKALEQLGLQPNTNGQRFEPVETACTQSKPGT